MTALADHVSLRGEAARDVLAVWLTITAALTYLDVPLRHSPLFAANIVLQASLGMLVITRLLRGVAPSLLLLCGPGLILGGALSFAVFQVAGRGLMGLLTQLSVAVIALILVLRKSPSGLSPTRRMTGLLQVTGLAALAMSSEFPWLLIVAGTSLLATMALGSPLRKSRTLLAGIALLYGALLAVATLFRGASWWLITDDYKFFEVLSYHVTRSGPFSDWGELNVSRYHWLSYGWSGLLDYASGSPEVLVTLTRVMPLAYSLALASSLLFVVQILACHNVAEMSLPLALPLWLLIASVQPDWSAPSTGGALSVIAAVVACSLLLLDIHPNHWRRFLLYSMTAFVVTFTKLPTALTLFSVFLATEVLLAKPRVLHARGQRAVITTVAVAGVLTVLLLQPLSWVLSDLTVQWFRPPGQSLTSGLLRSAFVSLVSNIWIPVLGGVSWLCFKHNERSLTRSPKELLIFALVPLFVIGAVMSAVIPSTEKANVHEYFSKPNFFLAALPVLLLGVFLEGNAQAPRWRQQVLAWLALLSIVSVWLIAVRIVALPGLLNKASFRELLNDGRVLFGVVVLSFLLIRTRRQQPLTKLPILTLLVLSLGSTVVQPLVDLASSGRRPERPADEIVSNLGPPDSKAVGTWLRENTPTDDLIATNSLFLEPSSQVFGDDYSLAMWSRREFLVLGPKFFGVIETAPERVELGVRFAREPTARDADALSDFGVRWFVIDLTATPHREWTAYGEIVLKTERFWVLELLGSSPS